MGVRSLLLVLVCAGGCSAPAVGFRARVEALIEGLDGEEPDDRVLRMVELLRLGPLAEPSLRSRLEHPRAEVAARCAILLEEIETRRLESRARVKGRVVFVDSTLDVVLIGTGMGDLLRPGMAFDICRGTRWIALAEFAGFLGTGNHARLRVLAGRRMDIRVDDLALHF